MDTLHELMVEQPGAEFFLLLGADQALAFDRWHRFTDILANATICIAERDQSTGTSGIFSPQSGVQARLASLQMPLMQVSATDIRQRVAAQLGVAHLVPGPIARYIDQHQLYQTT